MVLGKCLNYIEKVGGNMTLKFNGIDMPIPKINGFKISKNKIWSRNTGRNDYGSMVGSIIAIKNKVEIEWPPLSNSEVAAIDDVVSDVDNPFVPIEYTNERGEVTTITAYFGDVTYPVYSMNAQGKMIINGVKISGIEQ